MGEGLSVIVPSCRNQRPIYPFKDGHHNPVSLERRRVILLDNRRRCVIILLLILSLDDYRCGVLHITYHTLDYH